MKKSNKYHWLIFVSVLAFSLLYLCACKSETKNSSHYEANLSIKVIDNKIKVGDIEFYKFIPVDGGSMSFSYKKGEIKYSQYSSINNQTKEKESNLYDTKNEEISSFFIGETPVTSKLWELVMNDTILQDDGAQSPLDFSYVYITKTIEEWKVFIKKLSDRTGREFELPTSYQWEYAARGGRKSKDFKYAGSNILDDVTIYTGDNIVEDIYPFGKQKCPNELGLYDMSGGVWEFAVLDNTTSDIYGHKKCFVIRGGAAYMDSTYCETKSLFPWKMCEDEIVQPSYGARLILKQ